MRLPTLRAPASAPAANMLEVALPRAALHLGLSLLLLTNSPLSLPGPSLAAMAYTPFTASQKIAAEAWRVADNNYVDRTFSGQDWFQTRQGMARKKYADKSEVRPFCCPEVT